MHPCFPAEVSLQPVLLFHRLVIYGAQQLKVIDVVQATRPHAGRHAVMVPYGDNDTTVNQYLESSKEPATDHQNTM